jgi:NAD-dependent deacetylase
MSELQQLAHRLSQSRSAVAFTGAGISTESGIPDFRSPGGIWSKSQPVYFDDFLASESARYEYWRQKSIAHREFADAKPNAGHRALASWEKSGWLKAVITQNIDGLHQDAGSRTVLELHGTARHIACLDCQARYEAEQMVGRFLAEDRPPECSACGGITKHATVSFGQSLPEAVLEKSAELSAGADLFLAMGSSLVVQPAASLPAMAAQSGAFLVIINRDETPLDPHATLVIHAPIGETLAEVDRMT